MSKLSDQINALPAALRSFVHDLETRADPAGDLRAAHEYREQCEQLAALVSELKGEISELERRSKAAVKELETLVPDRFSALTAPAAQKTIVYAIDILTGAATGPEDNSNG